MRAIIIGALLLLSVVASADGYLYAGAWSKHIGTSAENETHDNYGLMIDGWTAAYITNSYDDEGAYAGYAFRYQWRDLELSALVGAVYAYHGCYLDEPGEHKTVCPLIVPSATYTRYRLQPQIALWGNAVVLTLRFRLW